MIIWLKKNVNGKINKQANIKTAMQEKNHNGEKFLNSVLRIFENFFTRIISQF